MKRVICIAIVIGMLTASMIQASAETSDQDISTTAATEESAEEIKETEQTEEETETETAEETHEDEELTEDSENEAVPQEEESSISATDDEAEETENGEEPPEEDDIVESTGEEITSEIKEAALLTVPLTSAQNIFSISLPTNIPISVQADGGIAYAYDLQIINNGNTRARISSAQVTALNGWTIASYYTDYSQVKVNTKAFGLLLFGYPVADTGVVDLTGFPTLEKYVGYTIDYSASVAVQAEQIDDVTIGNIVFTVQAVA